MQLLQKLQGVLVKTSLVDYPGRVSTVWFLQGCNIRCPYCYNVDLVYSVVPQADLYDFTQVYEHLKKRKNIVSGFVISGGEPLVNERIAELIVEAKMLGYKVKLDTNGLFPQKLEYLFCHSDTKPDFIAMDIKTNPINYALLGYTADASQKLSSSIAIIKSLAPENREFRTVLVPSLVAKSDIYYMASYLPSDASWQFAQFRPENCLDERYNDIVPYTDLQLTELVSYAKTYIDGAILR